MPEHEILYTVTKTYSTLNTITAKTENIWFVCHGLGYLSRYFIKNFHRLDKDKNYIIAPQAPSKYYKDNSYKKVGASWLTKDNTPLEMNNILNYFNSIYDKEIRPYHDKNLIVLGYSQGVSVAMRWLAKSNIACKHLIMHSGGIPVELQKEDFQDFSFTPHLVYGKDDPYINKDRIIIEIEKATKLFGNTTNIQAFDGGHEVNQEILSEFV
jgi:predicted esterase